MGSEVSKVIASDWVVQIAMSESVLQLVNATYSFRAHETAVVDKSPDSKYTNATLLASEYPTSDQFVLNRISSSFLPSSKPSNRFTMNSQLSANDPSSNLHLLSKVVAETECATMIAQGQRVDGGTTTTSGIVNPKRVSLPIPYLDKHESMVIKASETPTTCVNEVDNVTRSTKSWKKKAILAMGKEEDIRTTTQPRTAVSKPDHTTGNWSADQNDEHYEAATSLDMNINGASTSSNNLLHSMTLLPPTFQPGPYDVLCGRGRACKDAPGNKAYREIIMNQLQVYADSTTKLAKGQIISNIMEQIKRLCYAYHKEPIGGFVKQNNSRWYDVGEFLAREKTSQCFRDALAALYSSSAQSKYLRRRASKDIMTNDHEIKHKMDASVSGSHRHSNNMSLSVGKMYNAIELHEVCSVSCIVCTRT